MNRVKELYCIMASTKTQNEEGIQEQKISDEWQNWIGSHILLAVSVRNLAPVLTPSGLFSYDLHSVFSVWKKAIREKIGSTHWEVDAGGNHQAGPRLLPGPTSG